MGLSFNDEDLEDLKDALQYIKDVGPARSYCAKLVREGAVGDESYTMHGDDLAGYCHSVNVLLKAFGLDPYVG